MDKMRKVRICVDKEVKLNEYPASCNDCGIDLAVVPPKKILVQVNDDPTKDHLLDDWTSENYFYCPKCQRESDYSEME